MELSPETLEKIDKIVPRYPQKRSATMPLLHLVQEEKGFLSREAIEWIAAKLDLEPVNVYELVTFYPMFREEPIGRRHIKVCRTLSCALNGAYELKNQLQKQLIGEDAGDSNEDYTIEFVECIACCGSAPVVQVDKTMHEYCAPAKASELADQIKNETEQMKQYESSATH